jgi:hypothetical protein
MQKKHLISIGKIDIRQLNQSFQAINHGGLMNKQGFRRLAGIHLVVQIVLSVLKYSVFFSSSYCFKKISS